MSSIAMSSIRALSTNASGLRLGLAASAVGLGFRHGIDWDHIAALTDLTGSQTNGRRSMLTASCYALGHALVVLVLGVLAIALSDRAPSWLDHAMQPVVGVTLLALGLYVFVGLIRDGRAFRMQSRWMLVFSAFHRLHAWIRRHGHDEQLVVIEHEHAHNATGAHDHEHGDDVPRVMSAAATAGAVTTVARATHRHVHIHAGPMPADPLPRRGHVTAFSIGMLHGVGAETPTQVLLFLAAAGAGGAGVGVLLLVCFLSGLLVSNTAIALCATFGFLRASRNFAAYATTAVVIAMFSLVVGGLLIAGQGGLLPALAGG